MKRSKSLSSYFSIQTQVTQQSNQSLLETVGTGASHNEQNNPHVELSLDDIVADPGLRKPIEDLDVKIRDAARREYLQLGPCQPSGHKFPHREVRRGDFRSHGLKDMIGWNIVLLKMQHFVFIISFKPYAFYVHCFAHQLQLVVVSVAKCCSSILDFFNYTTMIVNTVNASCNRRDQLTQDHHDKIVNKLETGEIFPGRGKNQQTNLARPGDTRWGSHHKTLCRLLLMWDSVLEVLENLSDDATNATQKTTASGLLEKMESFEFVFIMHLMIRILGKTNDLSQCLQKKDQNIVRAVGLIGTTLKTIEVIRNCGWDELFEESNAFCLQHNILVPNMSDKIPVRGRSRGRGSQMVTYYDHFHHELFIVVHDQIIVELNNRFAERSTQLLRCIACLDPKNSFANFDEDKLIELARMYVADFSQYDCVVLRDQLGTFIADVRDDLDFANCTDLGNLAVKMVQTDRHTVFPLVYRLIELALILPVATATVERAFSAMSIIKTDLRNKMNDEWMNHSMVCYIERDIFASTKDDKILERFQGMRSRKKQLSRASGSGSGTCPTIDEEMVG